MTGDVKIIRGGQVFPRLGLRGLGQALTERHAFGLTVFVWWAGLLSVRGLVIDSVKGDVSLTIALRSISAMLAVAAVMFLLGFAAVSACKRKNIQLRVTAVSTIFIYVVASLAVAMAQIVTDPRLSATSLVLVQRSALALFALLIVLYCIDQRMHQLAVVAQLIGQRRRLMEQRRLYDESLHSIRERLGKLVSRVAGQTLLVPIRLSEQLLKYIPTPLQIQQVASATRVCASDVVRELSHVLDDESNVRQTTTHLEALQVDAADLELLRRGRITDVRKLLGRLFQRSPFLPRTFGIFGFIVPILSLLQARSVTISIATAVVSSGVITCLMWVAAKLVAPHIQNKNFLVRLVCETTVVIICGIAGGAVICIFATPINQVGVVLQLTIGLLLFAFAASVIIVFDDERQSVLRDLSMTIESARWESARLQSDELAIRREVATLLHSDIQGRLAAIAAQLDQQAELLQIEKATQSQVRTVLTTCVAELRRTYGQMERLADSDIPGSPDLRSELVAIVSAWQAVMAVDVTCSDEVLKQIEVSQSVSMAIVTAIREGVLNALRHGKASQVRVRIEIVEQSVQVMIVDNGSGVVSDFIPGLGIRSIVRSGAQVQLRNTEAAGSELSVRIPVS